MSAVKWQLANSPALFWAGAIKQWRSGNAQTQANAANKFANRKRDVGSIGGEGESEPHQPQRRNPANACRRPRPKPPLGLADIRADWLARLRNAIETLARKGGGNIEELWGIVRDLEVEFSKLYGNAETKLSRHVGEPEIRELLRGPASPALPDETAAKP